MESNEKNLYTHGNLISILFYVFYSHKKKVVVFVIQQRKEKLCKNTLKVKFVFWNPCFALTTL